MAGRNHPARKVHWSGLLRYSRDRSGNVKTSSLDWVWDQAYNSFREVRAVKDAFVDMLQSEISETPCSGADRAASGTVERGYKKGTTDRSLNLMIVYAASKETQEHTGWVMVAAVDKDYHWGLDPFDEQGNASEQLDAVILHVKDRSVCTRGGPYSPVRVCRVPQPDWGRLPEFRRRRQPR